MSGKGSRRKGAAGEREAAEVLTRATGHEWRRGLGQCRQGGAEVPDVVCDALPDVHVEVKRGKRISLWGARTQARHDCDKSGRVPIVLARRDRDRWVVMVDLDDLAVLRELL